MQEAAGDDPAAMVRPRLHRWGAAGGIAFSLLAFAWAFLVQIGDVLDAPNHILDVYAGSGARAQAFAGTLVLVVATLCFIGFLADLVDLLRRADEDGPLPTVALAGGVGFLVLTIVAGAMFVVLPNLIAFDEVSVEVDPDLAAVIVQLGQILLFVYATAAAGALVLATSRVGVRTHLLPRWFGRAGYVLSGLLLVGFSGPPFFLLLLWIFGLSVALRPEADRDDVAHASTP